MRALPNAAFTALAVLPFVFVMVPLAALLHSGSWHGLFQTVQTPEIKAAFLTSLTTALATTGLCCVLGLPSAFLMARWRSPWKRVCDLVILLPIILPTLVGGMAELAVFGPLTAIGSWFSGMGLNLTDSWLGVVLAQSFVSVPFLILAAKSGFESVPRELPEAASLCGIGVWRQLIFLFIPVCRKAVVTGVLLSFTRAFGEFGATMMVAYHPATVPIELYVQFSSSGLSNLLPITVLVIVLAMLVGGITVFLSPLRDSRS